MKGLLLSASCVALAIVFAEPSVAQSWPQPVKAELDRLLSSCRSVGGRPDIKQGAITKAALTDASYSDHIIWTGQIDCVGVETAFGGCAGQSLVLIPGNGRGIRDVPAHSWRLIGEGPMAVEITGEFACATGQMDRCVNTLAWNGSAFATSHSTPPVVRANANGQPRSIVGDWAETQSGCASPMAGLVRIGAKSLTTDEMACTFRDVTRSGATITWTGSCNESGRSKPATVTATENGGRLTVRFSSGNAWAPLMRCSRT